MTIIENMAELIGYVKEVWKDEPFTLTIQSNSPDPNKPPNGVGWRKSISLESAIMSATKEVLVKIGYGTSNGYFFK